MVPQVLASGQLLYQLGYPGILLLYLQIIMT